MNMEKATAERLNSYHRFNNDVVEEVSQFADWQSQFDTYQDFFDAVGVTEPDVLHIDASGDFPAHVLDIRPKEHDPNEAIIYSLPMANPLDPNQTYQIATIAGTNPDKRVIAIGNPGGPGYGSGKLSGGKRQSLTRGNLTILAEPALRYAEEQKIERVNEVGYSYGALKATVAAGSGVYSVNNLVSIEPVVGSRSLARLSADLASTGKSLEEYCSASGLPTFMEARKDSIQMATYTLGLARLSNLVIARTLAKTEYEDVLKSAIDTQPDMKTLLAWGSKSELSDDKAVIDMLKSSALKRTKGMRLDGQKHAMPNDIHLQAAIVKAGLTK